MASPADFMSPKRALPVQGPCLARTSSFRSTLPTVCRVEPSQWDNELVHACSSVWSSRVQWAQSEYVRVKPRKVAEYVLYVDMTKLTEAEKCNQKMVLPFRGMSFEIDLKEALEEYPAQCVFALEKRLEEALEPGYLRALCIDGIVAVYAKTCELYHPMDCKRDTIATLDEFRKLVATGLSLDVLLQLSRENHTKIVRAMPDTEEGIHQQLKERVHTLASSDRIKEDCVRQLIQIYEKVYSRYEVFRMTLARTEKSEQIPEEAGLRLALQQEPSLDKGVEKVCNIIKRMQEEVEAWKKRPL